MISKRYIDGGDICKGCGGCCSSELRDGRQLFLDVIDCFWYGKTYIKKVEKLFGFDKKLIKFILKIYKRRNLPSKNPSCPMRIYRNKQYLCLLQARYGIEHKPKVCQGYICDKLRKTLKC